MASVGPLGWLVRNEAGRTRQKMDMSKRCTTSVAVAIVPSITEYVPWGYVCGYPTNGGDLYGGAHYLPSASASLTLQGKAIQQAAVDFGDGKTLPFTPCKKGYQPLIKGKRMVACLLHNAHREKRLQKEQGQIREGEADPASLFWSQLTDGGKEITKES
ncbi:hypothetical protein IV203_029204 [Nitzschia inconspicua]|uniref:Uncharacterized protein n=1 Tax=Nitzschia inconspicua TaxID=303405 RepID=A0A9K3K455_9STRA|nr:hypothetical protein IV203_004816 [Nitzschia inconspicua]KAG7366534.1 hypothetical protein IV203_029204 [Nitzschia inconspicua]